jgi:fumarate hydratase class II
MSAVCLHQSQHLIKKPAKVNIDLELEPALGHAIIQAAQQIMDGQHQISFLLTCFKQVPVPVPI